MDKPLFTALFYTVWTALFLFCTIRLLLMKRDPSSTLAWIFFMLALPIGGALIFLVVGPQRLVRAASKRKSRLHSILPPPELGASEFPEAVAADDSEILRLARQISEYPATHSNSLELLQDPSLTLKAMQSAIESATHFIHLEYYIIASDEVTEMLFDSLIAARKRGVEVRILYDALGSLFLKKAYFKRLTDHGIKISGFMPLKPWPQRLHFNFRNHRKILIVDGQMGFTGGANIGRQYLGRRSEHQWRDFAVCVRGPACLQLQDVFAKDWLFVTEEDLFDSTYFPAPAIPGDSTVQVLESGPDTLFLNLHHSIFLALNSAQHRILLTTPYFIPDSAIMSALMVAALRGVEVKLLLPLKSDARLVQLASRSFYGGLLNAGAEIYEYEPRILHSKMLVIDDQWTILGSGNMDIRSFRLNFELNLLVYGKSFADQATDLFMQDLGQSRIIGLEEYWRRPVSTQLLENFCRLFSPVL